MHVPVGHADIRVPEGAGKIGDRHAGDDGGGRSGVPERIGHDVLTTLVGDQAGPAPEAAEGTAHGVDGPGPAAVIEEDGTILFRLPPPQPRQQSPETPADGDNADRGSVPPPPLSFEAFEEQKRATGGHVLILRRQQARDSHLVPSDEPQLVRPGETLGQGDDEPTKRRLGKPLDPKKLGWRECP